MLQKKVRFDDYGTVNITSGSPLTMRKEGEAGASGREGEPLKRARSLTFSAPLTIGESLEHLSARSLILPSKSTRFFDFMCLLFNDLVAWGTLFYFAGSLTFVVF